MMTSFVNWALRAVSLCAAATAAWAGEWVELTPGHSPSPRGSVMAYDAARDRIVLFGGSVGSHTVSSHLLGDTWEWDGTDWTQVFPTHSPSPRTWYAMAFDERRERIVLFGGATPSETNEVWEWDGVDWVNRTPASGPAARRTVAMAYDPVTERIVMFGGYSNSQGGTGVFADTWSWDGSSWTQLSPASSPPARAEHSMATAPDGSGVFLYGGSTGRGSPGLPMADAWAWNGATWQNVTPSTSPPARYAHGLAPTCSGAILTFGGSYDLNTALNLGDSWEWDGISWTEQSGVAPVRRGTCAMAYDAARGRTILFGGGATPAAGQLFLYNDTWAYVDDTTAPEVICGTDITYLWPANHKMVQVAVTATVSDACMTPGSASLRCVVSSDEPDNTSADGSTTGDTNGSDGYTAPVTVQLDWDSTTQSYRGVVELRAERAGSNSGRTYTILCEATDPAGNTGKDICHVEVPHDQSGKTK